MILLVILTCFLFAYGLLLFYYQKSWRSIPDFESSSINDHRFISVIIPARNEENNIIPLLKALENQTYPKQFFEVIVIDDYSTDHTAEKVKSFNILNLKLIQPDANETNSSKKKSIESGIKRAQGELIVTTDADCLPLPGWLKTLNDFYVKTDASFIAAPVLFTHEANMLQIFQAIDFLMLQGITAASVGSDFHTMCNGANLAYKKQAFLDVNGYDGIDNIASGDDMLLMYKIYKKNPGKVFYLKSRNSIVTTSPMLSWKDFIMQRKRWASKTFFFDDLRVMWVLVLVYLFNILFIAILIMAFINSVYWIYAIAFLLIKTIVEWPFLSELANFYKERKLLRYFIILQPIHIFYTVFIGLISQFGAYDWKGRRTK